MRKNKKDYWKRKNEERKKILDAGKKLLKESDLSFIIRLSDIDNLPLKIKTKNRIKMHFDSSYGLSFHRKGYIFISNLAIDYPEVNSFISQLNETILHELIHSEILGIGDIEKLTEIALNNLKEI